MKTVKYMLLVAFAAFFASCSPSTFQMKIYDESWSAQKPCEEVFGND